MNETNQTTWDVAIVGGSFAGLATAMQLRGRKVLLVEQRPIGTHQTSTCCIPLSVMRATGTERSALELHRALVLHTAGKEIRFRTNASYVTFDYYTFCQAMLAQTDVAVWLAKATGYSDGVLATTRGPVRARFIVDASGWQSLNREAGPARQIKTKGYGIETELPVRLSRHGARAEDRGAGLHFYFEKRIVRNGYAWVFPCGQTTRIGVGTFDNGVRLGPVLDAFLRRFGLEKGSTHGGVMALGWREPVEANLFRVGDAAGQCLPVTAEGIRTAIFHATNCGRFIAAALDGRLTAEEAGARYRYRVQQKAGFHAKMLFMQEVVARSPEALWSTLGMVFTQPRLANLLLNRYLEKSGLL